MAELASDLQPPLPPGPYDAEVNSEVDATTITLGASAEPPSTGAGTDEEVDAFFTGIENDDKIRTSKEERKRFAQLKRAGQYSYVRDHDQVFDNPSAILSTPSTPHTPLGRVRPSNLTSFGSPSVSTVDGVTS